MLASKPPNANALTASIQAAEQSGDWAQAATLLSELQTERESDAAYWTRYAAALRFSGAKVKALGSLRRAHRLAGDTAPVLTAMAETLCELGAREQAWEWIEKAHVLAPGDLTVSYSRALILIERFDIANAVAALRQLLDRHPEHQPALSALLYLLNLAESADPTAVAEEHCRRATACYVPTRTPQTAHRPKRQSHIRLGFISGDFRDHPVGRFAQPLLEHLDRSRFDLYGYDTRASEDPTATQIRSLFTRYYDATQSSDDALEAQIRSDQLDLLIDLSGHTSGHRMAVLTRRPAPLQIEWLGYPNTSGLTALDYRILDPLLAPVDASAPGSEQIVRLPGSFACFRQPPGSPEVIQRDPGTVVYGSPHRLEKLSDGVVDLWSQILLEQPQAKLLLIRDQLDGPRQSWMAQRFRKRGVGSDQLLFQQQPSADYWSLYAQFDVLLDCFPWSGHTLACEALWMGVPVVTMIGDSVAGRLSASALHAAGLEHWIAASPSEYRRIAQTLASESHVSRAERRAQIARSALCDEHRFTAQFAALIESLKVGECSSPR